MSGRPQRRFCRRCGAEIATANLIDICPHNDRRRRMRLSAGPWTPFSIGSGMTPPAPDICWPPPSNMSERLTASRAPLGQNVDLVIENSFSVCRHAGIVRPGGALCCLQIDDHSRLVDLLVEPDVLASWSRPFWNCDAASAIAERSCWKPGSHQTPCWKEMDSNFRSLSQRSGGFGLSSRGIR